MVGTKEEVMQVWIREAEHRVYHVMVNGEVYDIMRLWKGKKLSRNDMRDIADGYREYFASE